MEKGLYPEEISLKNELSPELYQKVAEIFKQFQMPMTQVDRYKPWFVSLNFSILEMQKMGMKLENGIDMYFINKANASGREIIELETAMMQMEILTSLGDTVQKEQLEYSVDNFNTIEETITGMISAWQKGDADLMNQVTKEKMASYIKDHPELEDFYDKLFLDRDNKMVKRLQGFLTENEKKTYFVIVGAGHLIGAQGILEQLSEKGYKAKQL